MYYQQQQSPRRNNTRELPRASAASLFDTGMNTGSGLNQFNQVQFDSFVNEAPQQPDPYENSMSLPPIPQTVPPPASNWSGPHSLDGNTTSSNPYRSKGRGGKTRQYNTASSLFGNTPQQGPSEPISGQNAPAQASFNAATFQPSQNKSNTVSMDSFFQQKEVHPSVNTQVSSIMDVNQPESFAEYTPSVISAERRKKAEEENDRLRAEKEEKRGEMMERINQQRAERIAQQEKEKEQIALMDSFQNDSTQLVLTSKPKSKEERKNVRDRARKARSKRAEKANQPSSGDLSSLIDEISSRGGSICSDLSLDHHGGDQSLTASQNHSITGISNDRPEMIAQNAFPKANYSHDHFSNATYPNEPPPPSKQHEGFSSGHTPSFTEHSSEPLNTPTTTITNSQHVTNTPFSIDESFKNTQFGHSNMDVAVDSNMQSNFASSSGYQKQNDILHQTFGEQTSNFQPPSSESQLINDVEGNEQYYMHYDYTAGNEFNSGKSDTDVHKQTENVESHSGGSSGSGSSYAMVSSAKSTESEPRLSPYQFVDNGVYPTQSSLNSNESSPLDVQNMSTTSTYEKVSLPSGSMTMSSFEMTGGSSSDIRLHSTSSMIEAIEEASEPIPVTSAEKTHNVDESVNHVLENKKRLQEKAAALFEEAKQFNQQSSLPSSGPQSWENHSSFSAPTSPNPMYSSSAVNTNAVYVAETNQKVSDKLTPSVSASNHKRVEDVDQINRLSTESAYPPEPIVNLPPPPQQQPVIQSPPDVVPSTSLNFQQISPPHGSHSLHSIDGQNVPDPNTSHIPPPHVSSESVPNYQLEHEINYQTGHQLFDMLPHGQHEQPDFTKEIQQDPMQQQIQLNPTQLSQPFTVNSENALFQPNAPASDQLPDLSSPFYAAKSDTQVPQLPFNQDNMSNTVPEPKTPQPIIPSTELHSHSDGAQISASLSNSQTAQQVQPLPTFATTANVQTHYSSQAASIPSQGTSEIFQPDVQAVKPTPNQQLPTKDISGALSTAMPFITQHSVERRQESKTIPKHEPAPPKCEPTLSPQDSLINELFGGPRKTKSASQPEQLQQTIDHPSSSLVQPTVSAPSRTNLQPEVFTEQLTTALASHQQQVSANQSNAQPVQLFDQQKYVQQTGASYSQASASIQQEGQIAASATHQATPIQQRQISAPLIQQTAPIQQGQISAPVVQQQAAPIQPQGQIGVPVSHQMPLQQQGLTGVPIVQQAAPVEQQDEISPSLTQNSTSSLQQQLIATSTQQVTAPSQQQTATPNTSIQPQHMLYTQQAQTQPAFVAQNQPYQQVQSSNENIISQTPVNVLAPAQQGMYSQQPMYQQAQDQQTMMAQYYQQMGYTPEQIQMMMQQYQYDPSGMAGYGADIYSQMWYQQQQQYMQQMYYYNYWQAYNSYPSSVASSAYGDSRPGSVIERRSSRSSDHLLSELGDLTSEMSFQHRSESPQQEEIRKQRTTPLSFTRPHIKATFSKIGGILNVIAPRQPLDGEIASVQNVSIENIVGIPLLKRFPGPLLRGDTNKKQITNFIFETVKVYLPRLYGGNETELFAHIALWEFVGLLVKQNGTFDGSDVADLLINLLPTTQSGDGQSGKGFRELSNPVSVPEASAVEEMEVLLATGRAKDGLDHAIQSGLWGHAFMLATLMGHKYLAIVQNKFSATVKRSDPIKTLYNHLSNKDPNSIKKRVNADTWVQNLCMLISQPTSHPEKDREKILCFGDTLRDLGITSAAHLCYLVANENFGYHKDANSRMVLLGQEHKNYTDKQANVWADSLNIQLTEIYQYACTLHEKTYSIPQFQQYKYEYAMKLVDYGYSPQALAYLESISEVIRSDDTHQLFTREICTNISKHANKILLQEVDRYEDLEIPDWVEHIDSYANQAKTIVPEKQLSSKNVHVPSFKLPDLSNDALSSSEPPFSPILPDTSKSGDTTSEIASHSISDRTQDNSYIQHPSNDRIETKEETMSTWQQQDNQSTWQQPAWQQQNNEPAWQHNDGSTWQQQDLDQVDTRYQPQNEAYQSQNEVMNYQEDNIYDNKNELEQSMNENDLTEQYNRNLYSPSNDQWTNQQEQQQTEDINDQYEQEQVDPVQEAPFQPYYPNGGTEQNEIPTIPTFFNPTQTSSNFNSAYEPPYTVEETTDNGFHQQQQQTVDETGYEEEEDLFASYPKKKPVPETSSKGDVAESKNDNVKKVDPKKKDEHTEKKGLFGRMMGLFERKEAFLPDDKDKSLVYDEKLQRWVDKNADPSDTPAPPPPPPTGGFGMAPRATPSAATPSSGPTAMPPSMPAPAPVSASPPSHGMIRPSRRRRTLSNNSKRPSNDAIMPQTDTPSARPQEPQQQSIHGGTKTLLKMSKEGAEEKEKPSAPPSMFSLKAQGGRRGPSRYAKAPGAISTKSTPMTPILDPFGKAANKSAINTVPPNMAFFTPGAPQKSSRLQDQH